MLRIALFTVRPGNAAPFVQALDAVPGVALTSATNVDDFRRALADAEVAMLPMYLYDAAVAAALREAKRLRWIQSLSVGVDRLLKDPPPSRVIVTTAGGSMAVAISEHAIGLLLALSRRLPDLLARQAQGRWEQAVRRDIVGLSGKVLAIVGYGAIGAEIALRAKAFGMTVIGVRRTPAPDGIADEIVASTALDAVLARADAVAITAPLTEETRGLFDARRFDAMRRGAFLLNVSRGAVVDSDAVAQALASGQLAGAGLDVVEPEPLPPQHPLWTAPNLILTPHVAAAQSEPAVARHAAENVRRFIAGEPLLARHDLHGA
jgi:phosphoglycerate dehydrogenase-like enzyme